VRSGTRLGAATLLVAAALAGCSSSSSPSARRQPTTTSTTARAGAATNVYAHAAAGDLSPVVAHDLHRVYVPNSGSGTVSVIDPSTFKVIDTFPTGKVAQHVVPSYDLRTLWVNNNGGSLTPIDPTTGKPGPTSPVDDPYNMYFTPDGRSMIVVAEAKQRLDFRDPHTLKLEQSVPVQCPGVNHIDYSADYSYFLATCEFAGKIIKVDTRTRIVLGSLDLGGADKSQPQDVRLTPDGKHFYVADMMQDGVHVIDGDGFRQIGFIPTGVGTHGIYPSRDGTRMYISNRGSHVIDGPPHGPGSVSVVDPSAGALGKVVADWPIPHGGSPDMGNVSADGAQLWLSGRYDSEVYCFDTKTGALLARIPVGLGPHGLTVWPQPGRYSLGHTGNMR
jgi:YVTN family beta-propeller protein